MEGLPVRAGEYGDVETCHKELYDTYNYKFLLYPYTYTIFVRGTTKLIEPWNADLPRGARFAVKSFKLVGVPREKREPMAHAQGPLRFSPELELNDLPALNEATKPYLFSGDVQCDTTRLDIL